MSYEPLKHHRRSIRLHGYDYASKGSYFITVCTHQRECLFGEIVDEKMRLNDFGEIVREEWLKTKGIRLNVDLDAFVVMPNHVHGIIMIRDQSVGATRRVDSRRGVSPYAPTEFRSPSNSIGAIIRGFKDASAKRINNVRGMPGHLVWQRNYYEHIIRNEDDLDRIQEYIQINPSNWMADEENPQSKRKTNV